MVSRRAVCHWFSEGGEKEVKLEVWNSDMPKLTKRTATII